MLKKLSRRVANRFRRNHQTMPSRGNPNAKIYLLYVSDRSLAHKPYAYAYAYASPPRTRGCNPDGNGS